MAQPEIPAPPSGPPAEEPDRPPSRLVLASEALKEDLAPSQPGARVGRLLVGAMAIALGLLGLAVRLGMVEPSHGVDPSSVAFTAAAVAAAVAALPFSYELRAAAVAVLGLALMGLGVEGLGPAVPVSGTKLGNAARFAAISVLPAALLFRARYRAYPKARIVLTAALLLAVPFLVGNSREVLNPALPALERASALGAAATALGGLFGFMGYYTTGGGSVWAAVLLCAASADVAAGDIAHGYAWLGSAIAAVGTACAATLVTLGLYHLLSTCLAADARSQASQEPSTLA